MDKTNVMRLLDGRRIPYTAHSYDPAVTDGQAVAALLGEDPNQTFKTLVTTAGTGAHFVFVIPVNTTLNLKKAAAAAGVKSIAMLAQKDLLGLTGYIHGGCSPIGMKKKFPTFFDSSILNFKTVLCSAGKVGRQIEIAPEALIEYVQGKTAEIGERNV